MNAIRIQREKLKNNRKKCKEVGNNRNFIKDVNLDHLYGFFLLSTYLFFMGSYSANLKVTLEFF